MTWATSDPDATYRFTNAPTQATRSRCIKQFAVVAVVLLFLLVVAVALALVLPDSRAAMATAGLLWGLGFSTTVILLVRRWRHV
jgi:uncharacterized membrane protein YdjX (TVP38/TMEM64 family)